MTRNIDKVDKIVGANLRAIRTARGFSQEALGKALGVSFQQIQKYENGSNAVATTRIPALCRALNIAPGDLLEGTLNGRREALPVLGAWATRLAFDIQRLKPAGRRAVQNLVEAMKP